MSETRCRSCGGANLETVVDLGEQPLANNLLTSEDLERAAEPRFPLVTAVCRDCWLMQIRDLVPPVELFSDYVYFSSFSDAMLAHAREASHRYIEEFGLGDDSFVVEIASNDGYLLKNFVEAKVPCLGIEPAANIAAEAEKNGIESLVEFFGSEVGARLASERGKADLVLGNNVFAHAPETNDFVAGIAAMLAEGGRAILEFPYGVEFVENTEFDTIYHEHVFYFTLAPLVPLLARHGLEAHRVERIPIHGGSLRLFAGHAGAHAIDGSVAALAAEEAGKGVASMAFYREFSSRVDGIKADLLDLLARLKAEGKSIAAYGASAKGSTLMNFVAPPEGTIDFIADRSTHKQGKLSPGLHLPIVAPEMLWVNQPDYTLLLTWNFADEILEQQAEYREGGGRFIVPIPEVHLV